MADDPARPAGYTNAETALGGADAVPDTAGIASRGTGPGAGSDSAAGYVVKETPRANRFPILVALLVVAVLIVIAYGLVR